MMDVSVVMVIRDVGSELDRVVGMIRNPVLGCTQLSMVIVDMGSDDQTADFIDTLLSKHEDIEYLGLSAAAGLDTAYLAGMEHVVPGNGVILFDPLQDDPSLLLGMVEAIQAGDDLVVVVPTGKRSRSLAYRVLSHALRFVFMMVGKGDVRMAASRYRALSPRAVAYVTRHESSALGYAHLPFMARFRRSSLEQSGVPAVVKDSKPSIGAGFRKALSLATAGSRTPLRFTSGLCLTAAMLSLLSSAYVSITYFLVDGVAPGWTTLSLQMNGMFFLLSVALAVMSEYLLSLRAAGMPSYHIASSACSTIMKRRRPNVEAPKREE